MFSTERMNNKGSQHQGNNDNSWGGNVRKSYDNYYNNNNNRGDYQQHDGGIKIEQRMQNMRLDGGSAGRGAKGASGAEHKESGPKKMTWASIASQPAKPQITTSTSTTKKKGFGPPPPMIPGKHNMELTDGWDTPKNGPLVPPSPPVIPVPQPEALEKQKNSTFDDQPAWPTPDQAQNQSQSQNQNQTQSSNLDKGNYSSQQHSLSRDQPHNNNQRGYHHSTNNHQNNYQGHPGRQYNQNSSGRPDEHQKYNTSHHYNDFQKPYHQHPHQMPSAPPQNHQQPPSAPITRSIQPPPQQPPANPPAAVTSTAARSVSESEDSILEQLRVKNQYNPGELDLSLVDNARFFVIKSYSEDDIHRSIKYEIWCSTEHGNKRLDQAFREREKENGVIYLFFSVNSSGHFCGVAQMITSVDYNSNSSVWSQDKWKGSFRVKWIYVKDVPNTQLRHIRLENNENKPVTNSRDTQEVPNMHGIQMMKIIHGFKHTTSIFDDFTHYEKRQEEEDTRKHESHDFYHKTLPPSHHSSHNRENMNRQQQQYDNGGGRGFDRGGDRGDRDFNNGSGGGFERGNYNNGSGGYNKYGNSSFNNDFKPFNNGRGGFHKRNDFRNDRNGDQQSGGGFYRAKPDYQQNDDFANRGGYRSERGNGTRGGRGSFRPSLNHNN